MTTNRRLLYWFRKYNRLYWGGRLKEIPIYYDNIDGKVDDAGQCILSEDRSKVIAIAISIVIQDFNSVKTALLHEMEHYAIYPKGINHGRYFYAEQDRVYALRAYRGIL